MKFIGSICSIVLMVIALSAVCLKAQPGDAVYATSEHNNGSSTLSGRSVTNASEAYHYFNEQNPTSSLTNKKPNNRHATLKASSAIAPAWLHLTFPSVVTSTVAKPVTVYIRTSGNGAGLLGGGTEIKAYNNTSGENSESNIVSQTPYYLADGTVFIAVVISSNFQSVRVTLYGPVLGVNEVDVYYAFYGPKANNSSNPYPYNVADCGLPNVTTKSFDSGLLSLLTIDNMANAIDSDATGTQSSFRALLGITGLQNSMKMKQMFYFNGPSNPENAVRLIVSKTTSLLSATILGNVTLQAYRGDTLSGNFQVASSILEANLLTLFDTAPVTFYFAPKDENGNPVRFDRVEVILEVKGLTLAVGGVPLNIHDVRRVPLQPTITTPNTNVCTNVGKILLGAASSLDNLLSNLSYNWYNSSGNSTGSGSNLNLDQLTDAGTYTYYVDIKKDGCDTPSGRRKVEVVVTQNPTSPPINLIP
ncbi:Ig-like domain-containing protein [Dyadobacter psychrotolerans]|uniref:Ig-like domain-containing protein n=1 Tax=Dyadobacter psychrotolerans TaxID=2541721 RepID=A0A4R5DZF0_9BACT|nr:hypothetical protein [Dyadobacter psychrotolerans]TDE17561.1 hypothetical protein E0F88_06630 [Dyadobacter psychrotolerans]